MPFSTFQKTALTTVLGLIVLWFVNSIQPHVKPMTHPTKTSIPHTWETTQSITWELTRHQPEQQNIIQTNTWHYTESTQLSQFTAPVITLITPKSIITLQSQAGQTLNNESLQLINHVKVIQSVRSSSTSTPKSQPSTLTTQSLTYNSSQAELLSHDTITLTQKHSMTTGTGLYADLTTGRLQIMSNVTTLYTLPK